MVGPAKRWIAIAPRAEEARRKWPETWGRAALRAPQGGGLWSNSAKAPVPPSLPDAQTAHVPNITGRHPGLGRHVVNVGSGGKHAIAGEGAWRRSLTKWSKRRWSPSASPLSNFHHVHQCLGVHFRPVACPPVEPSSRGISFHTHLKIC